jgi:uncharacterized SAM-binding protein YcdF (DUF218 family)
MRNPFRYFNSSPEVIRVAVLMYVRYPLSLRQVEDLLYERGIDISYETVRFWWNRFGPMFAAEIRNRRIHSRCYSQWRWHLDEAFVRINGQTHYLWRVVDHEGEVLEVFATKSRDRKAALRFLKRVMKRYGRLLMGAELARRFPQARLVYASGAPAAADPDYRESDVAGEALRAMGIGQDRIILERDSRNTRENALFAKKLVNPQPDEVWLLVTSAWHMPRAIGVFRKVGWPVHPFPVDVMTEGGWRLTDFTFGGHLNQLDRVAKEWVGLVAYRLAGWTPSLFPGPESRASAQQIE